MHGMYVGQVHGDETRPHQDGFRPDRNPKSKYALFMLLKGFSYAMDGNFVEWYCIPIANVCWESMKNRLDI